MSSPSSLADARVAILGLGLMGGSLALALKGQCRMLLAYDPDPRALILAGDRQVVHQLSLDPTEIVPQADLVVLAAPVRANLRLVQQLPSLHSGAPVVLDLGSTKTEICRAFEELPPRFDPIGGHPMCGKETSGLDHAEAGLFQGAPFVLTPLASTTIHARNLAIQLVEAIRARLIWLDPVTHDRWTAATSHMPYLLSVALALSIPPEAAPLVGPGLRSTTRLASSSTTMMADILHTNRDHVLVALERFRTQLDQLETSLRGSEETKLYDTLERGATARKDLLNIQPAGGGA